MPAPVEKDVPVSYVLTKIRFNCSVAVSCGYSTCFAVRTCDWLCHLIVSMDHVGIPLGFHPSESVSGSP